MKITAKTKTSDILPLLTPDSVAELLKAVDCCEATTMVWSMTIAEFSSVCDGTFIDDIAKQERKAYHFLRKVKATIDSMDKLTKYISKISPTQTPEEIAAAKGIEPTPLPIRMAIDCVGWFHLHSLEEAEKCKVADWLTFYEDMCRQQQVQRNLQDILNKKQ